MCLKRFFLRSVESKYLLLWTLYFKALRVIFSIKQIQKISYFNNFKNSIFVLTSPQTLWEHSSLCACFENVAKSKFSIADLWPFSTPVSHLLFISGYLSKSFSTMSSILFSWQKRRTRCWLTTGTASTPAWPVEVAALPQNALVEATPMPQSFNSCLQREP